MTTAYSISFNYYEGGLLTFNGIFTVDGSGTILSFYDIRNPNLDILTSNCNAINKYIANPYNFQANIIYTAGTGDSVYFKLSSDGAMGDSYTTANINCDTSNARSTVFIITPYISPTPSNRFSLKQICCSIYSDNARVYYKPHSLPSCGVGTVKNSRHVAKKT